MSLAGERKRVRRQIAESTQAARERLAPSEECIACTPVPLGVYRMGDLVAVYRRHFCGRTPVPVPLNKFYATLRVR